MNKILIFTLLTCLILTCCACGMDHSHHLGADENTTDKPTMPPSIDNEMEVPFGGDEYLFLTLVSLEEYKEKVINSPYLPSDFVFYEKISWMGEFKSLVFTSDTQGKKDYSEYFYTLIDPTGRDFYFHVKRRVSNLSDPVDGSLISYDSMGSLSEKYSGFYEFKELTYKYTLGNLAAISWNHDGIDYHLSGAEFTTFSDYPDIRSTLIGRLLNITTALDALDDILSALDE